MEGLYAVLAMAAAAALLVLLLSYIFFRMGFYVPPRKKKDPEAVELPEGEIYEVFWEDMRGWIRETRAAPHEDVSIVSFDGLRLTGKFYELAPGAPIEIMFHGYRGNAERDLSGGMQRCFRLGRSALIVDQRCSGGSEGNVITFGIKEYRDCLEWVAFARERFGADVKLILTGISMGASTVLMAGGTDLPENVIGILADCGFNSAKDIIQTVIRSMGLPPAICYPFVKLGAKLYGHFDLEENSAEEAVRRCKVPVIFFHGETDDYVPCEMSRINYEACASRKKLVLIPGAGHGLSYPVGMDTYMKEVREFFGPEGTYTPER